MEFWGVEVKPGEPLKIKPEVLRLIHISQAALGEVKDGKGPNYVPIHLKVGDKKYVIGSLSAEDRPQLMFDLVFEREFELSHDWKDGSIYFAGYVTDDVTAEIESDSEDDSSDEDGDVKNQLEALQNGKVELKVDGLKPAKIKALPAKPKPPEKSILKHVELKKDESDEDEDEDDDDSDVSEDDEEGEETGEMENDSSEDLADMDSEDSDDGNQDLESQKTKSAKKRASETSTKMLVPAAKKTKSVAPQKLGGKSLTADGKSKEHNPKAGHQVSCKSCSKTFNSENALQSHAKAKHGDT